ncbi:MAG: hypothetical protein IPM16_04740 [Chloroflexi bacterium]|nr:hypothetical protein [Chloroflexota bacterium]
MSSVVATALFVYLALGIGLVVTSIHKRIWDVVRRDGVVREDHFGVGNPNRDWYFNKKMASAIYFAVISIRFVGKILLIVNTAYLAIAVLVELFATITGSR